VPSKNNIVGGQPSPNTPGVVGAEQVVDPTFNAARVSLRPDDHLVNTQQLGHYRVAVPSGLTTGLAAGNLLFSMRYGDPSTVMLLKRIQAYAAVTTTFTAGQILDVDAISVRSWTTSDSAGTAVVLTGNNNKVRTNMGTSKISVNGDIRVATAAAITAGGTKTPDANAFGYGAVGASTAADVGSGGYLGDVYKLDATNQHPIIYATNEGFNLRLVTAQGAAGVVKYYFVVEWAELIGF
jgi:hypothetical protein